MKTSSFFYLSEYGDYLEVVDADVFELLVAEAGAVDDDGDAGDLSLGLQGDDG